jgi:acetyltransferase-like isoleucine patch superfamily enzyme
MPAAIGKRAWLGNFVVLYEGVTIGSEAVLEDYVRVGYGSSIGNGARIMYGAFVCDRVAIGAGARVAGFVCDASWIGDGATAMGKLVHRYDAPESDWWGPDEPSPRIEANAVVGMGSIIVGGVTIGAGSYVAAGAIVTRDVPPNTLVTGVNGHMPKHR